MDYLFIVQEKDKKNAWGVKLKVGVKPAQIDSLGALANKGLLAPCDLDKLRKMEDDFTQKLLQTNAKENFVLQEIPNFTWQQKTNSHYLKTDILNKNKEACSK